MVSASFFPMFGATAQLGRTFTAEEDSVPNANPVVVLSDAIWRSRFGGDPTVVGRTLVFNDVSFLVLGIMQPGFAGLSFDTDVWFPAAMVQVNGGPGNLSDRGNRWLGAVARLRDGMTMEQAQHDADRVAAELTKAFPEANKDRGIQLFTLRQNYLGSTEQLLLSVFAAVGLLLLIACANVAGLQLVRSAAREHEMALRQAIGAARSRVLQQLIVEGVVLAALAAFLGLLIANWGLAGLLLLVPLGTLPAYATPAINLPAFVFAMGIGVACGVLFGLVPALRGRHSGLVGALKDGSRGSSGAFGSRFGPQQLVVVAQTAFALLLLVGAGMFVRSLQRELSVSLGFDPENVKLTRVSLPARYNPPQRLQFAEQLKEKLRVIPSVQAVALGSDMPLGGASTGARIYVPEQQQALRYFRHAVAPDFFQALEIPIVEGRTFAPTDRAGAPLVAAINASAARRLWPNESAVGKRLRLSDANGSEVTVVAVVGDVRFRDLRTALATSEPDLYFPLAQRPSADLFIGIKSTLTLESILGPVRREVAEIDPGVSLSRMVEMQESVGRQTANGRFASSVLAVFAATALTLTAVGLYAVLAYLVSLRRREIGIRIALGATPALVMRRVIGHGVLLITVGIVVGLFAALGVTKWISSQLFGIAPHDSVVFITVTAMLLAIAGLASWLPARRAAGVDPQIALRLE